jgi:hypothetical protein
VTERAASPKRQDVSRPPASTRETSRMLEDSAERGRAILENDACVEYASAPDRLVNPRERSVRRPSACGVETAFRGTPPWRVAAGGGDAGRRRTVVHSCPLSPRARAEAGRRARRRPAIARDAAGSLPGLCAKVRIGEPRRAENAARSPGPPRPPVREPGCARRAGVFAAVGWENGHPGDARLGRNTTAPASPADVPGGAQMLTGVLTVP